MRTNTTMSRPISMSLAQTGKRAASLCAAAVLLGALSLAPVTMPVAEARGAPESFADLVEDLSPAVVNISIATVVEDQAMRRRTPPRGQMDDMFRDFFNAPREDRQRRRGGSLGSGFVVDPSGIIVTNHHVVEAGDEITVTFTDGLELEAKLLGSDEATDLAVLKVEHDEPLPHVDFGDSDKVRVGDWVVAIGNPFGLGGSVTAGIVSARNRNIQIGNYDDFIQTDAAINPGNSGGPLFDLKGRVVGVNTVIFTRTGGSDGIGFAIPSSLVEHVVGQIVKYGETRRGWLGVGIQSVTPTFAEALGLDDAEGALVGEVTSGSPADRAGVESGDVILEFDGKKVTRMQSLPRLVSQTEIGKTTKMKVFRDGRTVTLTVEVGEMPDGLLEGDRGPQRPEPRERRDEVEEVADLGLTLAKLSDDLRAEYDLPDNAAGVLVMNVERGGPAAGQLRPGDVIHKVGSEEVSTPAEVNEQIRKQSSAAKRPVMLMINRGGQLLFTTIRPE